MSEFSLIDQYCRDIGAPNSLTKISVGDDAAVVVVPADKELVVSVDTMVEGVHFFADVNPARLAHKLIAVNVSDMAAMGATPQWATLALTLPTPDQDWLAAFSSGLGQAARTYGMSLIGGDTTSGPLTLSLQILGLVPQGQALRRSGAQPGDLVFVSGCMGDAALALTQIEAGIDADRDALEMPQPQVKLGERLLGLANAAIDVSDGLIADLLHIARASGVVLHIDPAAIPLSSRFKAAQASLDLALYGGDDYQLAFTVPSVHAEEVALVASDLDVPLTKIGGVVAAEGEFAGEREPVVLLRYGEELLPPKQQTGYDHFAKRS